MALVRSRDTKPEMRVRRALHAAGLRYRLHGRSLPGRPDIVFASRRVVVFVHGCFWHRHPGCSRTRTPRSRIDFWERKFRENETRDALATEKLESAGWTVMVVWECESSNSVRLAALAAEIRGTSTKA